ncbi:sulfurtransferase, partial [Chishuiella sp.]|uniref:sulfurtransferase n=1 Tax=Chishuiella sp. TaxID=1969467 RepID=UPI0028A5EE77
GINKDSILICYDRWGVYSSPRVWWMFKVMGFNNVFVLNGGLPSWKQENYSITNNYILENKKGNFIADFQFDWYVNKEIMLNSIDDFSKTIIDARSEGRFRGIDPEPRKGLRSGNIPNSKNLFFENVLDGDKLKSKQELENIFSCGSGVTASILALAANFIGYDKVKVYDGSWSEWGADENLPISK